MVALENCGINIWRNCKLTHINIDSEFGGSIQSVEILKIPEEEDDEDNDELLKKKSDKPVGPEAIKIACLAFIGASKLMCSVDVFSAVNDSGLVFDGGIVVDKNFRTVDPSIYAVGDASRFSRYFSDVLPHSA